MSPRFGAVMASAMLVAMFLVSVGAVEFWGNADALTKVLWPVAAFLATWRCASALRRDAIAMEARQGADPKGLDGEAATARADRHRP